MDWIGGEIAIWRGFDSVVRCDCGSTAVLTSRGWVIFDPLALSGDAWAEILDVANVHAIALTNGNHQRDSLPLKKTLQVSIHAPESARGEIDADFWLKNGEALAGFSLVDLPGATPGESAWCDGRRLVLGDALIHFDQLEFLPDKYCTNPAELRKSVRKLLDLDFDSVFFAHGLPLLTHAHEKIAALLA